MRAADTGADARFQAPLLRSAYGHGKVDGATGWRHWRCTKHAEPDAAKVPRWRRVRADATGVNPDQYGTKWQYSTTVTFCIEANC
jgi:hypothetical protein